VKPVELVGFRYQEELLEALRKDLSERAETGRFASPLAGWVDTVEPPYLQIVCSQLWEIEKDNSERNLRFATYRDHGGAEGLLKSYVQRVLARFSAEEKRLASLAFNFLVTRHGTKMAYTVGELAKTVAVDVEDLAVVLENLRNARILRSLKRKDVLWYELYHDLFSGIIEEWNDAYKTRQRSRRIAFLGGIVVVAGFLLFTAYDITRNLTEKHFRLNLQRGISDTVELYRGDSGSMDLLALQRFETETEFGRANIEPDKMFRAKSLEDADRLSGELIGYLPSEARIRAYWEVGMVEKALNLADKSISEDDVQRSNRVISGLVFLGSLEIVDLLNARLADEGESYLRQLGLGRSEAVAPSIESLKDEDLEALMGAASALGQQGRSEAVAPLIESLKDADRGVLMSAASALGQLGSSEAVAPLIEILKAANSAVRESAASALGELGRSEAVAPLIECLGIATWSTRREALVALGRIGDARSNGAVSAVFRDGSENRTVKLASAIALLALGPDEGLSYLHSAVNSPLSSARRAVASTLSELPVDPSQTFELLEPLLDDPVLSVKIQALKALRNAGFQPGEEKEGKRNTAVPAGRRRGDWRPPGRQDAGAPSASLRDEEPAGCRRSQRGFSALDCRLLFYGTATNARVSSASKGFSTGHRRITPSTAGSGAYPWHPLDRGGR
jgi:HEAT repeat protein